MPITESSASPNTTKPSNATTKAKKTYVRLLFLSLLVIIVIVSWQFLNSRFNSTDPAVAGHPLSIPHTHLHTISLGDQPNVLYLGTHYGLFISTDRGHTWPKAHGMLDTFMITSIAVSPANPQALAVVGVPTSGLGAQIGIYFSSDGGKNWHVHMTPGLPASAYPYIVQAGSANENHFYAFYQFAGWFETRDLGMHWYAITTDALSGMQTPSLLTDSLDPNHLLLGGDKGLYETHDDGAHWSQLTAVAGNVQGIVASRPGKTDSSPRIIFCATDSAIYRWQDGSVQIIKRTALPGGTSFTRLSTDEAGKILYGLSGRDLWYSADSGATWQRRWQFARDDLISLVVDPVHPNQLYAGFFLPAQVLHSTDSGSSWQNLTN